MEMAQCEPLRSPPPLIAIPTRISAPLSYGQERLWLSYQCDPVSTVFNIPVAVRFKGPLDVSIFERAINEIIARHGVLRTTFDVHDGRPVQVIHPSQAVRLLCVELEGLPPADQEVGAREIAARDLHTPFELDRGPLIRVSLVRMAEQDHLFFLTIHHIVMDGWSWGVLIREFARLYESFSHGEPSPLPPLAVQYSDYAAWQRDWLRGETLEQCLGYWQERLAGAPAVLNLAENAPRPAIDSGHGSQEMMTVPEKLTAALKQLSQREGVTLFITLSAVFKILLNRRSGAEDIVVGSPVADRNRSETRELIGFFVNTLVLRTDLSGDPTLAEVLRRERATVLGAYQHQDAPFEMLVARLNPDRTPGRHPLFQAAFVMQPAFEPVAIPGMKIEVIAREAVGVKTDLELSVEERGGSLNGVLRYHDGRFRREFIQELIREFGMILEIMASSAETNLSEVKKAMLRATGESAAERRIELKEANARKLKRGKRSAKPACP
jgi:hypothetical protein